MVGGKGLKGRGVGDGVIENPGTDFQSALPQNLAPLWERHLIGLLRKWHHEFNTRSAARHRPQGIPNLKL